MINRHIFTWNRFIVLPQLLDDYLQQTASNVSRSHIDYVTNNDANVFNLFTAEVSFSRKIILFSITFLLQQQTNQIKTHIESFTNYS